jgi:phospholipid/cholesterol/gamma-HCH transport system substrate-binding protein
VIVKVIRLVVFIAITLSLIVWIGAQIAKVSLEDRYTVAATFDDVTGLFAGDDVKLAGVTVGKVSGIELVEGKAHVKFEVNKTVHLPADSTVAARWLNLIGQRQLYLYPGKATETIPQDGKGEVKQTTSVVDLGQLINALGPLGQAIDPNQLNAIFTALVQALDGNDTNIDSIVVNLNTVIGTLASRDKTIDQMLTDYQTVTATLATRDTQIQTMIDNLVLLSQTFAANSKVLDDALVQFSGFNQDLDAVLGDNEAALSRILQNLALVLDVGRNHLSELEQGVANLPPALQALFTVSNTGEYVTVDLTCLTLQPTCPPALMQQSSPAAASTGALDSPDAFNQLLIGRTS